MSIRKGIICLMTITVAEFLPLTSDAISNLMPQDPAVVTQPCTLPADWKPKGFHFTPTFYCKNVKCRLITESWGNPDPAHNTFCANVNWTLTDKKILGTISGKCVSVVNGELVHPYCRGTANGSTTCAYMYSKYMAHRLIPA